MATRRPQRLLPLLALLGCGPSFESIHESEIRFEHCYRLDLDRNIAPSHRYHCWQGWLDSYADGQPRDRIEYGRQRVRVMRAGDTSRPTLNVDGPPTPPASGSPLPHGAPGPSSPDRPPPATVPLPQARPKPLAEPTIRDPGEERDCLVECYKSLRTCRDACVAENSTLDCDSCERDFTGCSGRCVQSN